MVLLVNLQESNSQQFKLLAHILKFWSRNNVRNMRILSINCMKGFTF